MLPHHQRVLSGMKLRHLQSSQWNVLKSAATWAVHRMLWVQLAVGLQAGVLSAVILRQSYTRHCQHLRSIQTSLVTSAGHTHCHCWPPQSIKISSRLVLTRWVVTHRMLVSSFLVFCAVLYCDRKELLYASTLTVSAVQTSVWNLLSHKYGSVCLHKNALFLWQKRHVNFWQYC